MKSCTIFPRRSAENGIALILVMIIVLALSIMAGVFAYSIKLESKLANNTDSEVELEWLGRSGVEMARWILVQQSRIPRDAGMHALNQFWAGGPGGFDDIDSPFIGLSLRDFPCGEGKFSLTFVDQERKINLNNVDPIVMDRALALIGGDASDSSIIFNSIKDWTDADDATRAGGGTESDFYLTLDPPYLAKNGPMDDITELLKVRGVTPELFWGTHASPSSDSETESSPGNLQQPTGLVDLFCANSSGQLNVNTASAAVLSIGLGIDPLAAERIVERRSGPDGVSGTEDDTPFRSAAEVAAMVGPVGGLPGGVGGRPGGTNAAPGGATGVTRTATSSTFFEVTVDAVLGSARRRFVALIRRGGSSPADRGQPVILSFRRD